MQLPPLGLVFAAGLATLGIGQAVLPTAHAQATAPQYQVVVRLHTAHTKSGLETTGTVFNTGSGTLTYTSIVLVFKAADGAEAATMPAYLTNGPVGPGQCAELRSASPEMAYASVSVRMREAGHPVAVQLAQNPVKQRTTVR